MKKLIIHSSLSLLFLLLVNVAVAGELKTVTLSVDGMTCNMCPITVKKALQKIDGVTEIIAKYEGGKDGWARVTYDSDKVKLEDLTFATEEAGYPSRPKQ